MVRGRSCKAGELVFLYLMPQIIEDFNFESRRWTSTYWRLSTIVVINEVTMSQTDDLTCCSWHEVAGNSERQSFVVVLHQVANKIKRWPSSRFLKLKITSSVPNRCMNFSILIKLKGSPVDLGRQSYVRRSAMNTLHFRRRESGLMDEKRTMERGAGHWIFHSSDETQQQKLCVISLRSSRRIFVGFVQPS
ncbi:hypothetical protein EVAR_13314_1 [Eumeta japonica]|uniref:Uncharacterized protein n=1 Tax=Eumeta variegata TaxID=151549 RepID=A0A4C1TRT4_EUMVA|nr:hypothetical protein EVAR_13314_1 [Eumeta japonica]